MKKIIAVAGLLTAALSTAFAVNVKAKVYLTGNLADGSVDIVDDGKDNDPTFNFLTLNKQNQQDDDALIFDVSGEKAGAHFQGWYQYDGSGSAALKARSTSIWIKPLDSVKVTLGDIDVGTYIESIDWWKVAAGEKFSDHQTWTWSSYASVSGVGVSAEWTPVSGLWLTAGVASSSVGSFAELASTPATVGADNTKYARWGVAAKYDFNGATGLPITGAVSFRDGGTDEPKIIAVGFDYGQRWSDGFYGFLNARFRFEKESYSVAFTKDGNPYVMPATMDEVVFSAIALDNMFKFKTGAFTILGRFPFTVRGFVTPEANGETFWKTLRRESRLQKNDVDPCWMSYEVRAEYSAGPVTYYFDIENDNAVTINKDFAKKVVNATVQPGATFNIGSCSLDIGLQVTIPQVDFDEGKALDNLGWAIPFAMGVSF